MAEQLFVSQADEDYIERHGDEYGINKTAATAAVGTAATTGTNGITIEQGTKLQDINSVQYSVDNDVIIAGGTAVIDLTATADYEGDQGNQDAATILTFVSPIPGVSSEATIDGGGMTGGVDEQTKESYRSQILRRKQFPPYGGTANDYETWMLEYAGVTRAWVFEEYNGVGTVGCAFVMDDSTPYIPNAATIALVRAYLVEHEDPATGRTVGIPVTAEPGLTMLTITEQDVNFEIAIYPNTADVQSDIDDELADLIKRDGGVGTTLYLSDINSALANVTSLERHTLDVPATDNVTIETKIHALGTTTYTAY